MGEEIRGPAGEARILVVDDEEELRSVLARFLDLLGYQVGEAATGYEALRMLEETPYDVAVVDIRMPGMDGVELMHRALRVCPDLSIVFLTGHASLDSAVAAVRSHAANYLIKPVTNQDLADAVAAALQWRAEGEPPDELPGRYFQVGAVTLDLDRRVAIVGCGDGGESFRSKLTVSEMMLLTYLMKRPGVAATCQELATSALGYDVSDEDAIGIIRPHISRLRAKLQSNAQSVIHTVPGQGYLYNS